MGEHKMRLQLVLLVGLVIASTVAPTTAQANLECLHKCGDVDIPYPFGTGEGCYLNEDFNITCNQSANPHETFLKTGNIRVTKILLEGKLHILQYIARDCYAQNGTRRFNNKPWLRLPQCYTVSATQNKFVTVGCDNYALIRGYRGEESYTTGCVSICSKLLDFNGSCSGSGCCQVSIPKGLWNISMRIQSYNNHTKVWNFNPCGYAFVVEEENALNFSAYALAYLQNPKRLPMVLDWAIGNETCEVARSNKTGTFACKGNTTCLDNDNGSGYRCECKDGYRGNPYRHDCQDIDECKDPNLNDCEKLEYCVNKLGHFDCSCPKGYHGDGRKDGKGCIANPIKVVQIALGIGISIIAVLVGSWWLYFGYRKRKLIKLKEKFFQQNGGTMLQLELSRQDISNNSAKIFTAEELKKATNNYDEHRIIGRGGYGTVYKGYLSDNSVVAIKKSKIVDQTQIEQFINEVLVLSQINHRNVVRLLGCCLETEVPLLVYEFVTNGTLFDHIYNESKTSSISWEIRLRIAIETAGVLSYLHSAASTPIIHRDVKSTNILLDDNYTAKVSDFGASKLVPLDQTELSTLVQGTLGYLDPEYLHTNQLTEKSDVHSFGVVLVELLTGKKALSFDRPEEERSLAMYFLSSVKENRIFQVLEDCIMNERNIEQLKEVANLAKRCLRVKGEERPTMREVAMELQGLIMMEMHPWVDVNLNSEETENFPGESSATSNQGGSGNTTVGYDSMRDHMILPVNDGR